MPMCRTQPRRRRAAHASLHESHSAPSATPWRSSEAPRCTHDAARVGAVAAAAVTAAVAAEEAEEGGSEECSDGAVTACEEAIAFGLMEIREVVVPVDDKRGRCRECPSRSPSLPFASSSAISRVLLTSPSSSLPLPRELLPPLLLLRRRRPMRCAECRSLELSSCCWLLFSDAGDERL